MGLIHRLIDEYISTFYLFIYFLNQLLDLFYPFDQQTYIQMPSLLFFALRKGHDRFGRPNEGARTVPKLETHTLLEGAYPHDGRSTHPGTVNVSRLDE